MIKKSILTVMPLLMAFLVFPIYAAEEKTKQPSVRLTVENIENKENKKRVQIKLIKIHDNTPLTLSDLKEAHTKKVHVMVIDEALEDYSHVHPKAVAEKPGVYEFEWQPKKSGHYRLWADLMPLHTEEQEYVMTDLTADTKAKVSIDKTTVLQKTVDGLTFTLSFDTPTLQVGKAAMGTIRIVDSKGEPVKNLEPLMGAFAHVVGFEEDFKTIIHVHPMGEEPKSASDRGGPEFQIHIEPKKAGFMRLFAQFRIQGKEVFVPFGVTIKK
jgi:hypothetical protein